jgi:SAM-dependent methyltransferase
MNWQDVPKPWIVDVGCGATAVPFANILIDKYLEDDRQRQGRKINLNGRPLIQADVCELPFEDESVDFIWCSHVLEHVAEPDKAINELQRVSRQGIILLPTVYAQAAAFQAAGGDVGHRWVCWRDRDIGLIFVECDTSNRQKTLQTLAQCGGWPVPPSLGYGMDCRIGWGWGDWIDYIPGMMVRYTPDATAMVLASCQQKRWTRENGAALRDERETGKDDPRALHDREG